MRRILIGIVPFNVLAVVAAEVAKRRLPAHGDQDSETFALVAALDGIEFVSRSEALRRIGDGGDGCNGDRSHRRPAEVLGDPLGTGVHVERAFAYEADDGHLQLGGEVDGQRRGR